MDTISRENNSMLPVGGIIVGGIALLIAAYAAVTVSQLKKTVAEQEPKIAKIETIESAANSGANAALVADRAEKYAKALERQTQSAFNEIGPIIGGLQASVTKLEEAGRKAPVASATKKGAEPVTAAPGEYVIKSGDTGMKIANANGVTIGELTSVNPGVNWSKLAPGQKIKLPAKK
jgi:LysM repeat protein